MEYPVVVDSFVTWCEQNHLQLHVTETKELIGDFKRTRKLQSTRSARGVCIFWDSWGDLTSVGQYSGLSSPLWPVPSSMQLHVGAGGWGSWMPRLNKMMCKASKMVRLELPKGSVGEEVQDEENTGQYLSPTPWQVTGQYNGRLRLPKYTTNYTGNWLAHCTIPPSKSQVHTLNIKSNILGYL